MDFRIAAATFSLTLLLSGCGGPAAVSSAPPPPMRSAAYYGSAPEGIAGTDARQLIAMFGQPRLDVRERTVRKLQFTNGRCVLDAYLYITGKKKEPVVTHIDTRLTNGNDTDAAACIQSLRAN
ncbi:MAG: hypothetical protein JJE34_08915 [Alphaproteobacteria bacterium]|nr:hypothetical protein [Alphaproteobacteria bacterium]